MNGCSINYREFHQIQEVIISKKLEVRNLLNTMINSLRNEFYPFFGYVSSSENMKVFILEDYKVCQDSDVAVTVMFDSETDNTCTVTIVSAGGKTSILRMDLFGAEKSMVNKIETFLQALAKERGWTITFPP
jgi:hypothetical protein